MVRRETIYFSNHFAPGGVSGLALNPAGKTLAEAGEDKSLRRSSEAMQEHIFALRRLLPHFESMEKLSICFFNGTIFYFFQY